MKHTAFKRLTLSAAVALACAQVYAADATDKAQAAASNAAQTTQQAANEAARETKDAAQSAVQGTKEMASDAAQGAKNVASDAARETREMTQSAKQGAKEMTSDAQTDKSGAGATAQSSQRGTAGSGSSMAQDTQRGTAAGTAGAAGMAAGAGAAGTAPTVGAADNQMGWSDRARMAGYADEKDRLEQMLQTVTTRDGYRQTIEQAGYRVTAINQDTPTELEYEVVKGNNSYEVQLDFDEGNTARASNIDVASNLWRAEATKRAMEDQNYQPEAVAGAPVNDRYRDRARFDDWESERARIEQMLATGMPTQELMQKLEQEGYQVTSINDREPGSLEFEIVKGQNSYEVQASRNETTGMVTAVDVAPNIWQSQETERALGEE